jgi:hypothetical protein
MVGITPSQSIGPFAAPALTPNEKGKVNYNWSQLIGSDLVTSDTVGERIRIEGRLFDGDGAPIDGTLFEIWQADGQGRYAHPRDPRRPNATFKGFGRVEADKSSASRHDGDPHARHPAAPVHADLFFGRGIQRRRSDPEARAGRSSRDYYRQTRSVQAGLQHRPAHSG